MAREEGKEDMSRGMDGKGDERVSPLVGCRLARRGIQLEACGGKCRCRDARTLIWLRGGRGEENGGASDVGALADERRIREAE